MNSVHSVKQAEQAWQTVQSAGHYAFGLGGTKTYVPRELGTVTTAEHGSVDSSLGLMQEVIALLPQHENPRSLSVQAPGYFDNQTGLWHPGGDITKKVGTTPLNFAELVREAWKGIEGVDVDKVNSMKVQGHNDAYTLQAFNAQHPEVMEALSQFNLKEGDEFLIQSTIIGTGVGIPATLVVFRNGQFEIKQHVTTEAGHIHLPEEAFEGKSFSPLLKTLTEKLGLTQLTIEQAIGGGSMTRIFGDGFKIEKLPADTQAQYDALIKYALKYAGTAIPATIPNVGVPNPLAGLTPNGLVSVVGNGSVAKAWMKQDKLKPGLVTQGHILVHQPEMLDENINSAVHADVGGWSQQTGFVGPIGDAVSNYNSQQK